MIVKRSVFSPGVCYRCQPGTCDCLEWSGADQDKIKDLCNTQRYVGFYIEIVV